MTYKHVSYGVSMIQRVHDLEREKIWINQPNTLYTKIKYVFFPWEKKYKTKIEMFEDYLKRSLVTKTLGKPDFKREKQ